MIGMTTVTFRNKSVDEIIEICKMAGVDAIEWGGDVHVPAGDVALAEEVYKKTIDAGLEVSSYGSYYWVGTNTEEDFDKVLASAKALHAKFIRIWAGKLSSAKVDDETFNKYVEEIKGMAKKAGEEGIIIASEFHNNTYNDSYESCKKLLDAVDSPYYKTYWQTVTFDERDGEYLKMLKEDIVNVHVFTWNDWGKRYPLKKKAKMWQEYIDMYGKNGLYTIEFVKKDKDKYFLKDVASLKEYLA